VRKFLLRYDTQMKVYEQPLILNLFWLADLVLFIVLSLIPYRFIRRRQTLRAYESEILQVIQGRYKSHHSIDRIRVPICLQLLQYTYLLISFLLIDDRSFVFTARCYASAVYAVMQCPSVCLSRSWITSKRINISSNFFTIG